jgi:3-oxoacyl-[acyl-carrier protein] reductase
MACGADGRFSFVGRQSHVIRRAGENLSTYELELLMHACPGIREVAVTARPDAVLDHAVVAHVVPLGPFDEQSFKGLVPGGDRPAWGPGRRGRPCGAAAQCQRARGSEQARLMAVADRRAALVTGGSRGIGEAIAQRLAASGHDLVIMRRDEPRLAGTALRLASSGTKVRTVCGDVRVAADVRRAVAVADAEFGRLDVAVHNAGVTRDNLAFRMSLDEWHEVLDTTLTGAFLTAQAAQGPMVRKGWGRLVFIGSTAAHGNRGQANYSAAKAGLAGLARTLAMELGRFGITVNVVEPGHVETDMTHDLADRLGVDYEDVRSDRIAVNSIKRVGDPDDVARAVEYLCSDGAGYVTGQILTVAGRPVG